MRETTYYSLVEAIESSVLKLHTKKLRSCPYWLTPGMKSQHQLERVPARVFQAISLHAKQDSAYLNEAVAHVLRRHMRIKASVGAARAIAALAVENYANAKARALHLVLVVYPNGTEWGECDQGTVVWRYGIWHGVAPSFAPATSLTNALRLSRDASKSAWPATNQNN